MYHSIYNHASHVNDTPLLKYIFRIINSEIKLHRSNTKSISVKSIRIHYNCNTLVYTKTSDEMWNADKNVTCLRFAVNVLLLEWFLYTRSTCINENYFIFLDKPLKFLKLRESDNKCKYISRLFLVQVMLVSIFAKIDGIACLQFLLTPN